MTRARGDVMSETAKNNEPDDQAGGAGDEPREYEIPGPDEIVAMEDENLRLKGELAEMQQKYLRTLADYQNSQRRAVGNEQEAKLQARTGVVQSILSVVDHFDLALAQDPAKATAEQIISGVKVIRDELMQVLQAQGVRVVSPGAGDEFQPSCHQAILQQKAEGVAPGRIVSTLQVGFTIAGPGADRVIRPAKVSVAPQESPDEGP